MKKDYNIHSIDLGSKVKKTQDESILVDPSNILGGGSETPNEIKSSVNQISQVIKQVQPQDIEKMNMKSSKQKESGIFKFQKINENDEKIREREEIEKLKKYMKTQYRVFKKKKNYTEPNGANRPEVYDRNRFGFNQTSPTMNRRVHQSPVRANMQNSFGPRSYSANKFMTPERGHSMSTQDRVRTWNQRIRRGQDSGVDPLHSKSGSGASLSKFQNSETTQKKARNSYGQGYNNFINVSVPSQYIILQNSTTGVEMPMVKRAMSVSRKQFMSSTNANNYINLTQIRNSNLRTNSMHPSERGSRSPHRSFHRRPSPHSSAQTGDRFMSMNYNPSTGTSSLHPSYTNYVHSTLFQVNELGMQASGFNQMQSTVSWVPSSLEDLLLLLVKKILVYSSKIDSLQRKMYANNPAFSVKLIFKEADKERKAFLTLHDMGYFLNYFGFQVSDWETFKLMGYLSNYKLTTLEELMTQEDINSEVFAEMQSKFFGGAQGKDAQSQAKKDSLLFYLNYENFSQIFKPVDKAFRPEQNRKRQMNYNNDQRIRESEFYLIRQIILLTFRKIDEIGMIVQYLKEYPSAEIYEFLCSFNEGMYDSNSKKSSRFEGNQAKGIVSSGSNKKRART